MSFRENFKRSSLSEKGLVLFFIVFGGMIFIRIGDMILNIFGGDLLKLLSVSSAIISLFAFIIGVFFGITFTDLHTVFRKDKDIKYMFGALGLQLLITSSNAFHNKNSFFYFLDIIMFVLYFFIFIVAIYELISTAKALVDSRKN